MTLERKEIKEKGLLSFYSYSITPRRKEGKEGTGGVFFEKSSAEEKKRSTKLPRTPVRMIRGGGREKGKGEEIKSSTLRPYLEKKGRKKQRIYSWISFPSPSWMEGEEERRERDKRDDLGCKWGKKKEENNDCRFLFLTSTSVLVSRKKKKRRKEKEKKQRQSL